MSTRNIIPRSAASLSSSTTSSRCIAQAGSDNFVESYLPQLVDEKFQALAKKLPAGLTEEVVQATVLYSHLRSWFCQRNCSRQGFGQLLAAFDVKPGPLARQWHK